jgi:hypothetical protein
VPFVVECTCGKKLRVKDELLGKRARCTGCGTSVKLVPAYDTLLKRDLDIAACVVALASFGWLAWKIVQSERAERATELAAA